MPLELQKCLRKLNQPTEQRSVNPFCPENAQIFTQKITNSYGKFEKFTFPLKEAADLAQVYLSAVQNDQFTIMYVVRNVSIYTPSNKPIG